jgi:hypothetical protein
MKTMQIIGVQIIGVPEESTEGSSGANYFQLI